MRISHLLDSNLVQPLSAEILQPLLNLDEFMKYDGVEGGLPIDISILAELVLKYRSYAKALHYKEREHIIGEYVLFPNSGSDTILFSTMAS